MPGKHHLWGFKIAKNRLAATRLVDDAPHRRWVKPPPLGKKLDPPLEGEEMIEGEMRCYMGLWLIKFMSLMLYIQVEC